ncbi:MAG: DUF3226 domain-containing protein [Chitinophagales bacterium]
MIKIFVEGKGDDKFLKSYLTFLENEIVLNTYEIIPTRGWTKIPKLVNLFQENTDAEGTNLIIFDADSFKNGGGFAKRKAQLEAYKTTHQLEFELFLFPNQQNDGDYETLLENIINQEHSKLLTCFSQYENCIENTVDEKNEPKYVLPIRKAKIYSYIDAFPKSRKQKERFKRGDFFFENEKYWNLKADYLKPLKDFLLHFLAKRQ